VIGPLLVLPWKRTRTEYVEAAGDRAAFTREYREEGVHLVFPGELDVKGALDTSEKRRGLFKARVYQWNSRFNGHFVLPATSPIGQPAANERIEWGTPWLAVTLDDPRGLIGMPKLTWNGERIAFAKGSQLKLQPRGVHAPLAPWQPDGEAHQIDFTLEMGLRGTERLALVPVGDSNRFELESPWQHPSFGGRFLPDPESQRIGDEGFHATWSISALAADAAGQIRTEELRNQCSSGCLRNIDSLDVRLVEPVAIYTLSDRALKYAHLFILLGFAAFFFFEALKGLQIHPIQYLLVGLALAVFFLLLISLSEHIAFGLAYALATLACCGLIGTYLATVLGGWKRGLAFGGGLGALFAALYLLLRSEDNALMLGSLLMFSLLAIAMLATRKVNWYALGRPPASRPTRDPDAESDERVVWTS